MTGEHREIRVPPVPGTVLRATFAQRERPDGGSFEWALTASTADDTWALAVRRSTESLWAWRALAAIGHRVETAPFAVDP